MSFVFRVLPLYSSLVDRISAKREKKKPSKGVFAGHSTGGKKVPDQVIAEIRWRWDHGWTVEDLRQYYPKLRRGYLWQVLRGAYRPKIDARTPTKDFDPPHRLVKIQEIKDQAAKPKREKWSRTSFHDLGKGYSVEQSTVNKALWSLKKDGEHQFFVRSLGFAREFVASRDKPLD